jgi:hypothetical protein
MERAMCPIQELASTKYHCLSFSARILKKKNSEI